MEHDNNESGRKRWPVILGALLPGVTAIVVAWIGIIPEIQGATSTSESPPATEQLAPAQKAAWQITGRLTNAGDLDEAHDVEIVLVPADGPYLTTTDSQGKFLFDGITARCYWILVRHAATGLNERVLVEADGPPLQTIPLPGGEASVAIQLKAVGAGSRAGAV